MLVGRFVEGEEGCFVEGDEGCFVEGNEGCFVEGDEGCFVEGVGASVEVEGDEGWFVEGVGAFVEVEGCGTSNRLLNRLPTTSLFVLLTIVLPSSFTKKIDQHLSDDDDDDDDVRCL